MPKTHLTSLAIPLSVSVEYSQTPTVLKNFGLEFKRVPTWTIYHLTVSQSVIKNLQFVSLRGQNRTKPTIASPSRDFWREMFSSIFSEGVIRQSLSGKTNPVIKHIRFSRLPHRECPKVYQDTTDVYRRDTLSGGDI